MRIKNRDLPIFFLLLFCITYVLTNPVGTAYRVQSGIKMCIHSVVPSLFIFMVFSRILAQLTSRQNSYSKITLFFSKVLLLPPSLIPICISGLFCSAPSGAFGICSLYEKGLCTKEEAERAAVFANNCSSAFILGFISSFIGCKTAAVYIAVSNILTTISVYMIFLRDKNTYISRQNTSHIKKISLSEIISDSISSSASSTVTLCGYVVFFYVLSSTIIDNLTPVINNYAHSDAIKAITASFFEIGSGTILVKNLSSPEAYILCSASVAFTGISMILQVTCLLNKCGISSAKYFISKVLCAIISPIYMIIIMLLSPYAVTVSAESNVINPQGVTLGDVFSLCTITAISLFGAHLLRYLDKKHKK